MSSTYRLFFSWQSDRKDTKSMIFNALNHPARGAITIENEYVLKAIAEKEEKIASYQKEKPDIKDFWLCVNIPIGSYRTLYGFEGITIKTPYDRVYLTDQTCVRIK